MKATYAGADCLFRVILQFDILSWQTKSHSLLKVGLCV